MIWKDKTKEYSLSTHPLSVVCELWNGKDDTYPGPQPTSIERSHFELLKNKRYYVCDKTDGFRYSFIACDVDGKHIACVMDRNLNCHMLKLRLPRECTKGTVLDGEIIQNKDGAWIFLVYDCVVMCGMNVSTLRFDERMEHTETFINSYKKSNDDALLFVKKEYYDIRDIESFINRVPAQNYDNDGLIFIPNDEPVRSNTHPTYFKFKKGNENTVDFALGSDGTMYLQMKGVLKKTINRAINMNDADLDLNFSNGPIIVECSFVKNKDWNIKMVRNDKNMPNSVYTHKKTMNNIKENIKLNEFVDIMRT